MARAEIIRILT
jgi:hypothetical protein